MIKMITIPVTKVEFLDSGNTIWVHNKGVTVLKIECKNGKIKTVKGSKSFQAYSEMEINGDINIIIPEN